LVSVWRIFTGTLTLHDRKLHTTLMAIWTSEIRELEKLYGSLKGQFAELERELSQLVKTEDPNVILLYSRRCLEIIITDLCECELKRSRKTEPLQGIIDKLNREEKVPSNIIASMHGLNTLSTFGTHPKDFDPEQIKPVLVNLDIIIKWYLKYKEAGTEIKTTPAEEIRQGIKVTEHAKGNTIIIKKNISGIIAGLILLIGIVAAVLFFTGVIGSGKQTKGSEKSIAVLPFKLLSDEPDKQYLADGMMDAITLHLSKIKDLRVMSRTSVEQYRETTKTTRIIGRELNVDYLLEGSFQKFGDNTKLIVQLIRASEESHVWANEYNSTWSDVFSLQSEVAQRIASELMVALTPEEIDELGERPTGNLEAYQAYLQGRYYAGQPHFSIENWNLAIQGFQNAVEIDTTFALAYGELARGHARLIYLRQDLSESRLAKAKDAAENALRLGSDQPRVHLALGYYYLYAYRDEDQALKHLEIAEKSIPNDIDLLIGKAAIIVTEGRWEEYIHLLEKALQLSPHDASIITDLAEAYWVTRRYRDAIDACNKAITISPNSTWAYLFKIFGYWSWKGPCKESRDLLKFVNNEHEWYLFALGWQTVGEGNFQEALRLMPDSEEVWFTHTKMWATPWTMFNAFIYDYLNEPELARAAYENAIEILEKKVTEVPSDPRYHSALGIAYAGLDRKEEAIKEGLMAVELLPVSKDAMYGLGHLQDLAIIYTKSGEYALALDKLEELLSIPTWVSPVWIEWDIRFAPLRTQPKYKELMIRYAVKE
jgi:TolB-like protein/Flp pilus assembly protein TadD